jgi:transmembrane sensor
MTTDRPPKLNAQISEEAAEWLVEFRLGSVDLTARRAFAAWVRSSPEHLRAYLEIAAIWNEGSQLDSRRELDLEKLMAREGAEGNVLPINATALATEAEVNAFVDDLPWVPAEPSPPPPSASNELPSITMPIVGPVDSRSARAFTRVRRFSIAASLLLIAGASLFAWDRFYRAPIYATAVGEQRTLTLLDGSTVELNSHSRVRVRFTANERDVDLLEGQALFHVAKNPARPFIVDSSGTRVRAVGTQFDVNRTNAGTIVTVLEGKVAVTGNFPGVSVDPGSPPVLASTPADGVQNVFLTAGDQLTVSPQTAPTPTRPNVAAATAWTHRQVILDSAPLAKVAEEFNRYSVRKLIVEDSGVTPLRLSGVFTANPDFLIRYLRERPDITIIESASEIHIIRRVIH